MYVPCHLLSTVNLIRRTFSDGMPDGEYSLTLSILYEHMSDRNLADAVSIAIGRDAALVYNDVLRVGAEHVSGEKIQFVMDKLIKAGFEHWIAEN